MVQHYILTENFLYILGRGRSLLSQGKHNEAEPLYHLDISIKEHSLGPDHPAVAGGVSNLAGVFLQQVQP